jgi:DNA-binding NarL/FixJ family response regulator
MDLVVRNGMGGGAAVLELLACDPHAKVIVSSGASEDPCVLDFRAHGFAAAATKPYSLEDLAETISRVLG